MTLRITSPCFGHEDVIPIKYTADGEDISPALSWSGAPVGVQSYALIVDDPDAPDPSAPRVTWVHWLLYDIPASMTSLPERLKNTNMPPGVRAGVNDWGITEYRGPKPPIGRHRYFFKLFALDKVLADLGAPDKTSLLYAMKGHVLDKATLVGTFAKRDRVAHA